MERNTPDTEKLFSKKRGDLVWINIWRSEADFTTVFQAVEDNVKLHFENEDKVFNEEDLKKGLANFDYIEFEFAGRIFNIQVHETDE